MNTILRRDLTDCLLLFEEFQNYLRFECCRVMFSHTPIIAYMTPFRLSGFLGPLYGIGKNLLKESIVWADSNGIKKVTLNVLETNDRAIELYKRLGFEIEGMLRQDKILSDGKYYNTIAMGRFNE